MTIFCRYCIHRSGTYNIHVEYCTCRKKDGCNSASGTTADADADADAGDDACAGANANASADHVWLCYEKFNEEQLCIYSLSPKLKTLSTFLKPIINRYISRPWSQLGGDAGWGWAALDFASPTVTPEYALGTRVAIKFGENSLLIKTQRL